METSLIVVTIPAIAFDSIGDAIYSIYRRYVRGMFLVVCLCMMVYDYLLVVTFDLASSYYCYYYFYNQNGNNNLFIIPI